MSKKFYKSRVIIFSIILLILIGFAFIQNKNLITDQTVNNPLFLQYKGDIYIDKKDKSLNLPFVFIDSTNSKLFNDLSDKIKSNNQYTSNDFLLFKDKTNNIEIYLKEADKGTPVRLVGMFVCVLCVCLTQSPLYLMLMAAIALVDRKSTRLNSSHVSESRMPSSA